MGAFVDLAQTCAPVVQVETLAAVVSLESRFQPYHIRLRNGDPLTAQPTSKAEAIELATSLMAEHQQIQLGLGGISTAELQKLGLSVSDAFDPCLNLKATGALLDGYYRLTAGAGAGPARAEAVMLQSYYGRGDPSTDAMAGYDVRVREEAKRLLPELSSLTVSSAPEPADLDQQRDVEDAQKQSVQSSRTAEAMPWDVFSTRRQSSVLVFQNPRPEPTE
ncbi:lytic transglycosylase domain-containing protein [Labrys okinawensis]|uniref:lytic transglycosylase domain-containing protein n=1 Tax=Labrys okinawensis TaxID=346911 RepID=UPI0039BCCFF3